MRIATGIGTAALALLMSTTAFAQDVTYDFDKTTDFSTLKTYAWVGGTVMRDDLNHKRIVDAVDAQLAAKGLTKVEASASPDVLVAYHTAFTRDLQISGFSSGWGAYRAGPRRLESARTEQVLVGTLSVDLTNPKTRTIVWRGIASKDVDVKADPEKRDKNINKTAEKLFKHYPPVT